MRLLVLTLLALGLVAPGCQRRRGPPPPEVVSRLALPRLDGQGVFEPRSLSGHPVLVSFWAPWCNICIGELPDLASAIADSRDAELVLVMVWGDVDSARSVLAGRALPGASVVDSRGDLAAELGVDAVPHTIAVDREGRSIAALHGGHDRAAFSQVLDEID